MDSIRVSEAPDPGSIPGEATTSHYFVYVIKSVHHNYYYKGYCQDLEQRLKEHNAGKTKSNRAYRPFE